MKPTAQPPKPWSPVRRLGFVAAAITTATISTIIPSRTGPTPLLFIQWPDWAKDIAKERQPGDVGLGDTVVHIIGDERSKGFQEWFHDKIGKSCGCKERQAWLNRRFPYL